jgi:hypothetical protein
VVSAAELLADLEAGGLAVTRIGDDLRVRAVPGVRLAPYRERVLEHKPALLTELLQQEIVAAVNVDPNDFDRVAYDHLWLPWRIQEGERNCTP